jgi:(hydroxyamino)benzene mutase
MGMETTNRQLMWHGIFLFLLGLVTGLFEQRFTNMRMGVSAHLEGLMNGTFLVVLGAIWREVRLPPVAKATAYWGTLYATYANWLITTLAAVFGTAASTPIASAGHRGEPWQESLVGAGFLSVAIVIIASAVLILWGLRPGALQKTTPVGANETNISQVAEGQ